MSRRSDILVRFGTRVRELRLSKGYSQESFAAKCNLDRTYVGGIERGERNVAIRNIESIAKALDMTLSELMEGL
ncbi:MAG: helix-turn-helix transcriptional regulator [Betaproteobacteria bacterium]|nr:helix-turn-helix transcriptional regulator [Betaproteobacteria bacterium]